MRFIQCETRTVYTHIIHYSNRKTIRSRLYLPHCLLCLFISHLLTIPDHAQIWRHTCKHTHIHTRAEWQIPLEYLQPLCCWLHAFPSSHFIYMCVCMYACVYLSERDSLKNPVLSIQIASARKTWCIRILHSFRFYNVLLFSYFSFLLLESIVWPYYYSAFPIAILPFTRIGHIFILGLIVQTHTLKTNVL